MRFNKQNYSEWFLNFDSSSRSLLTKDVNCFSLSSLLSLSHCENIFIILREEKNKAYQSKWINKQQNISKKH